MARQLPKPDNPRDRDKPNRHNPHNRVNQDKRPMLAGRALSGLRFSPAAPTTPASER
jgi:hypothetical protein